MTFELSDSDSTDLDICIHYIRIIPSKKRVFEEPEVILNAPAPKIYNQYHTAPKIYNQYHNGIYKNFGLKNTVRGSRRRDN